ncbi:coiled-coil domain-containing protein 97-like [Tubulanus polymorphus]|uniref:coiled-coil domain-containing protein 97-like n=1 Tax=Tubulanus polymorphus TaxID=672921 RepID=UPI003DA62AFD
MESSGVDMSISDSREMPGLSRAAVVKDSEESSRLSKSDSSMTARESMLSRVASSDAHFKHQQRGEPDLTYAEKYSIAERILVENPARFLSRFERFLVSEDASCFGAVADDYAVAFYLRNIARNSDRGRAAVIAKNRRYKAMQEMDSDSDDGYFGDEQMKFRDPYLFHQMVGRFETSEEAAMKVDKTDLRFSTILMSHLRHVQMNDTFTALKDQEESQTEETESDEDEETELEENDDEEPAQVSSVERARLRAEFKNIMRQRFLDGKDSNFDYSRVDQNPDYDSLELLNIDAEEKYFNGDEEDMNSGADQT